MSDRLQQIKEALAHLPPGGVMRTDMRWLIAELEHARADCARLRDALKLNADEAYALRQRLDILEAERASLVRYDAGAK